MGEMATNNSCAEIEKIKQTLSDEFKIHQRMIRSTAVEYQTLLKKTAVRLTNGLDSIYKEKLKHLDEIASKMADGEDVEDLLSEQFSSTLFTTYDFNTLRLRDAIEGWSISPSAGSSGSCIPMSTPSLPAGAEVKVDVTSGITKQGLFWLHLLELPESSLLALSDLHKQISLRLLRDKEWKSFKASETSPELGDYVLVDSWSGWMRGKVEKLKDDSTYAVRLVDEGDLISSGPDVLLPMKTDIYPDADYQAVCCCLSLDGDPFDIPIEAVWAFNDLLQENVMVRNPIICIFKEKIVGKDNQEVCQVDLMLKDKKQNSISASEALNKKIEDKAKGRDSIACRDIRYAANMCAVSRYVERPDDDSNSSRISTPVVSENAADTVKTESADKQNDGESCGMQPGGDTESCGAQDDTESYGLGLLDSVLGEQLEADRLEVALSEDPAQMVDGSMWDFGKNLIAEILERVEAAKRSDRQPEQDVLPEVEQPLLPYTTLSVFPPDLQTLPYSAPLYSPAILSSENLTAVLDKPSTLKPDAVPFVSRSQSNFNSLARPISVATEEAVTYQPDNFRECIAQEESVMEMHPCFRPSMSLPVHYPNYARAEPQEFGQNVSPVMPALIYPSQGSAYSYGPQVLDSCCIPSYPADREVVQGSYSHQETIDFDAPVAERRLEEHQQVEHLLPAICSNIGSQFTGEVTSQLERDGTVWMQLSRNGQPDVDAWNCMQANLSTCNKLTLPIASEDVVPGLFVTVPNTNGSEFYRGEVLSVKDRKAVLRCIDYGKTIIAPRDSLKPLLSKLRSLPRQAVQCRLYNAGVDGGEYLDQDLCKSFDNHVKARPMTANVMSIQRDKPEEVVVRICDNEGRDVLDNVMLQHHLSQRLASQRLRCQDDLGLSVMQPSHGNFSVSTSIGDTAALSQAASVFPMNLSQHGGFCCEPVEKLMAAVQRAPASLAETARASLSLNDLLCVPPPPLSTPSLFSQMGDANSRMSLAQTFPSLSDTQNEWNSQPTKVENPTNHRPETSVEAPHDRNSQSRRASFKQRYRDNERRSIPPLNSQSDSCGGGSSQQVVDDEKGRFNKKYSGTCFLCGETGHVKNSCPRGRKSQHRGVYGRTSSRK